MSPTNSWWIVPAPRPWAEVRLLVFPHSGASILHRVRGPRGVRRVQMQGIKPNRAEA